MTTTLRDARLKKEPKIVDGFRMRGAEVTRLESFSDAVFAFALTLLVVSLEVPKSYGDLLETMRGFVAFGVCFALLALIWNQHYKFSRRFGLDDTFARFLTCVLLFIVLAYVYPLKFLFNLFINGTILHHHSGVPPLTVSQASGLFIIYGLGFAAVYTALAALYLHAYRKRDELGLNDLEKFDTRWEIYGLFAAASVGLISCVVALSARYVELAGWVYFSLAIIMTLHGFLHRYARRSHQQARKVD